MQDQLFHFKADDHKVIRERPLVYWWSKQFLDAYRSSPKVHDYCPPKKGMTTSDNTRFVLNAWEILPGQRDSWAPYMMGASGMSWVDMSDKVIKWKRYGLEVKLFNEKLYGSYTRSIQNEKWYFRIGVAFSTIGANFSARVHRKASVIDTGGSSLYPEKPGELVCMLNSAKARYVLGGINPTLNYKNIDIERIPYVLIDNADSVWKVIECASSMESRRKEQLTEFLFPFSSPWRCAQEWAQQAVDRPEGTPLPEYIEELDPEPPTDHLSFALGVALGRFAPVDDQGQPTTSNHPGILDPTTADLSHALHAGILFLDGSLEKNDERDDLGTAAAAPLREAWSRYGSAIAPNRSLRDWLRLGGIL